MAPEGQESDKKRISITFTSYQVDRLEEGVSFGLALNLPDLVRKAVDKWISEDLKQHKAKLELDEEAKEILAKHKPEGGWQQ